LTEFPTYFKIQYHLYRIFKTGFGTLCNQFPHTNFAVMAPETFSLAGKTALITGSGRENGIGAAIAKAFARNGAFVAIHYVSEQTKARAEKLATDIAQEFGTKTTVVQGCVENHSTAKKMVEQALKGLNTDHIDILGM
jgi:NAD(P)-dependent dehydrogenase (short-subunit alcohol dehydrogenase family)